MLDITTTIWGIGSAWPELNYEGRLPRWSRADRPLDGLGQTAVSLVADGFHVLIDLGAGALRGMLRAGLPVPDLVVLTHFHPDHLNKMEIDSLARWAKESGQGPITIVTSAVTWQAIPKYQRNQFRHLLIEAGQHASAPAGDVTAEVEALDASAHCSGGLVYVVGLPGFRFGALFDQKAWDEIDRSTLEGLDLALVEGNTLEPRPTGHVSIAQDLALLNSLRSPPCLTLVHHYNGEERLSLGDLTALLAGLAPHLAVRMAHKGMAIRSSELPPRNPVAVLDDETNLIVGVGEKRDVHDKGLLHASVLLLVRDHDGRAVVYERSKEQSYPGCLDVFGGHAQPSDGGVPRCTALREGREEIRLVGTDGLRVLLDERWLVQIGRDLELESFAERNRERTTLFGIRLPAGVNVRAFDETDDGTELELDTRLVPLPDLERLYVDSPETLADGMRRILEEMSTDLELRAQIHSFISARA